MNKLIPWAKPVFFGKEKEYLLDAIDSTWISGGPYVNKLEKEFTSYNGASYGLSVSNGTTALQLALSALNIGPGDEVIVPAFSFAAASHMIMNLGAVPVYADVDPESWCIDPSEIVKLINRRTKAVLPVHTYGNVCDMDALQEISKKHGLFVIEDTAEAAFSKYNGKYAGTLGNAGCFSFQATKTMTTGEGGFVIVSSRELYEKMLLLRDHGMNKERRYWHDVSGYNFRLTNLQAALGCAQLENISMIISAKKRIYDEYAHGLEGEKGIKLQTLTPGTEPVVWTVAIAIDENIFKCNRDKCMLALKKKGIETRPGFYPFSIMPLYKAPPAPVSENVSAKIICLPSFCDLTNDEITYICGCLKELRGR